MSLINDALRRADMDQRQDDAGGETPTPPPLPPEDTDAPAPKRLAPWTVLLGLTLLILVGVMAYGLWWGIDEVREQTGAAVETASAAFKQTVGGDGTPASTGAPAAPKPPAATPGTADAAAADGAAPAETPVAGEAATRPAVPSETETPEPPDDEIESIRLADAAQTAASAEPGTPAGGLADTSTAASDVDGPPDADLLNQGTLDLRLSADAAASDAEGGTEAGGERMAGIFNRMLEMLQAASRTPGGGWQHAGTPGQGAPADATGAGAVSRGTEAGAGAAAKPQPAAPVEASPKTPRPAPLPPVDTSNLKISSIMSGPDGGLAIINGRPVREGETVAGAKVIRIGNRTVEVEIDGRRATVGM